MDDYKHLSDGLPAAHHYKYKQLSQQVVENTSIQMEPSTGMGHFSINNEDIPCTVVGNSVFVSNVKTFTDSGAQGWDTLYIWCKETLAAGTDASDIVFTQAQQGDSQDDSVWTVTTFTGGYREDPTMKGGTVILDTNGKLLCIVKHMAEEFVLKTNPVECSLDSYFVKVHGNQKIPNFVLKKSIGSVHHNQ